MGTLLIIVGGATIAALGGSRRLRGAVTRGAGETVRTTRIWLVRSGRLRLRASVLVDILENEMLAWSISVVEGRGVAPGTWTVAVADDFHAACAPFLEAIEAELAEALAARAITHGLALAGEVAVVLQPGGRPVDVRPGSASSTQARRAPNRSVRHAARTLLQPRRTRDPRYPRD